ETQQLLVLEIVANEMGLDIEDELSGQALGARQHQLRLACLGLIDLEHVAAVDFPHGEKRGGHAATRAHELAAAQPEPLTVYFSQFEDPPLEALLRLALRGRKILTVRYDLGRYRRCGRSRFGTRDQTLFPFTEPRTHRHSSLFEPEWLDGNDHVQYRRPDSTGDVKQPDLLRMRPVERTDRVRGGLQQYLAALFGEIRLSLRR